jgi:hypothetical protein
VLYSIAARRTHIGSQPGAHSRDNMQRAPAHRPSADGRRFWVDAAGAVLPPMPPVPAWADGLVGAWRTHKAAAKTSGGLRCACSAAPLSDRTCRLCAGGCRCACHAMPCRAALRALYPLLLSQLDPIRWRGLTGLAVRPTDCAAHALAAPREADRPGAGLPVHGVRRLMVMLRVVLALVVRQLCAAKHVVCRVCAACRTSPAVTGHRVSWSDASHVPRACVSCGCPLSDGKQNQHALPGIAAPLSSLGFWHYQSVSQYPFRLVGCRLRVRELLLPD